MGFFLKIIRISTNTYMWLVSNMRSHLFPFPYTLLSWIIRNLVKDYNNLPAISTWTIHMNLIIDCREIKTYSKQNILEESYKKFDILFSVEIIDVTIWTRTRELNIHLCLLNLYLVIYRVNQCCPFTVLTNLKRQLRYFSHSNITLKYRVQGKICF